MKHKLTSFQKEVLKKIEKLKGVELTDLNYDGDLRVVKKIPSGFVVITVFTDDEISLEYNYYDGSTVVDFHRNSDIILTLD